MLDLLSRCLFVKIGCQFGLEQTGLVSLVVVRQHCLDKRCRLLDVRECCLRRRLPTDARPLEEEVE